MRGSRCPNSVPPTTSGPAVVLNLTRIRLLFAGHTYDEVARRTHASSATISRVRRFLEYGADGYRLVLTRLGVRPASR